MHRREYRVKSIAEQDGWFAGARWDIVLIDDTKLTVINNEIGLSIVNDKGKCIWYSFIHKLPKMSYLKKYNQYLPLPTMLSITGLVLVNKQELGAANEKNQRRDYK